MVFISMIIFVSNKDLLFSISLITSLKIGTVGKLKITILHFFVRSLILSKIKPPSEENKFLLFLSGSTPNT